MRETPAQNMIRFYSSLSEVISARGALHLRRQGVARAGPFLGGIEAWRARSFPIQTHPK